MLNELLRKMGINSFALEIVERSNDFYGIASPEGKAIYINQTGRKMFGIAPDQDISKFKIRDFIPEKEYEHMDNILRDSFSQGMVREFIDGQHFTTNEIIRFDLSFFAHKNPQGELLCYMAFARDLRDSDEVQKLLNSIEEKLRVGGWQLDLQTGYTIWTDEVYHIHGVPIGTPIDKLSAIDFYAPHDRPRIAQYVKECCENGMEYDAELEFFDKQGNHLWIRTTGMPVRDSKGNIIRLKGIFQDITTRKKYQQQASQKQEQLEKLMLNAPGMIYQFKQDSNGEMYFPLVSDKAFEIYEVDKHEFQKFPTLMIEMVHKDDRDRLLASIQMSAQQLTPFNWEGRIVTKSGKIKYIIAKSLPQKEADGSILWDGIMMDISKEKEIHDQLSQNAKMVTIGELAAGVGHEINNPLAIAYGNITLLQKSLETEIDKEKLISRIEKIDQSLMRIKKIVDGLRTYARVEPENNEVISLNLAAEQTLNLLQEIYSHEGIKISLHKADKSLFIQGAIGKVQQILMIFIANARDASLGKSEERTIDIEIREDKSNHEVILSVADNGFGIPKDIRKTIFDPFFTTKPVGQGTGIGLNIAKNLVEEMHGKIHFETEEKKGTTFYIHFPRAEYTASEEHEEMNNPQFQKFMNTTIQNVLIVDDEKFIQEIMVDFLQEMNFQCDSAGNGKEALQLIENKQYDLIITDLTMPQMDGITLVQNLERTLEICPPLIILTGGTGNILIDNEILTQLKTPVAYLNKPFTMQELHSCIQSLYNK